MRRILAASILITLLTITALAQNGTLKGKIVSAENGEPLIGANIIVDDTTGTATDIDGNFTITVRPGIHKVLCRFLGCNSETQTIEIKSGENFILEIALREEATNLGTVVVSAGKFEQKIEDVTVSMAVIKPDLVENKACTSMETAINQVPGVQIVDSEPQIRSGSGYSFGAGSRVMIMVDDLPVLSGDAGRPSWNFLPVENLEQIEIIKGASSVLYGSAALNGIINIRTAYPKDKPETKVNLYSGVYDSPKRDYAKYWDKANPTYTGINFFHARKIGNLDLVIGGNIFGDNGYVGGEPDTVRPGQAMGKELIISGQSYDLKQTKGLRWYGEESGDFENRIRMNTNLRYRSKKIEGLNFGINFNGMYARSAGALLMLDTDTGMYRSFPGAMTKTIKTIYNIDPFINYYSKMGVRHSLRTRMYYEDNNNDNNQANQSTLLYGEYQFSKEFVNIKDMNITSGLMGSYSESNSELFAGNEEGSPINFARNFAFYTQLDKKLFDRITLSAGARWENFEINETDNETKPVFRAGLSARVLKATYVRASYGEGFRFPTIGEKYIRTTVGPMNIFPSHNVLSESSWNAEAAIKQGFKVGDFMGYLDVAVFRQEIENAIEFTFGYWGSSTNFLDNLGFKSLNVPKSRIEGVDISLVGRGNIGPVNINILAGYTYMNPMNLAPDDTLTGTQGATYKSLSSDTSGILKYRFQHLAKGDVEFSYNKWSTGISYRYNSFMKNLDKIFIELDKSLLPTGIAKYREDRNEEGDYVVDTRLSYQFIEKAKVAFLINNLLNREYMIRPLQIEAPRTFIFQFTIKV